MNNQKVCIIGSGISGLLIGAMLSKRGNIVDVFEKNHKYIGGHARTIKRRDHSFCMGPQYVWDFGPDDIGTRVLAYLGLENEFKLKRMRTSGFERVCFDDCDDFIIPMGLDPFHKKLIARFPEESEAIIHCFNSLKLLDKTCKIIHDSGAFLKSKAAIYFSLFFTSKLSIREKFQNLRYATMTVEEFFACFDISDDVKRILFANSGIFAENINLLSIGVFAAAFGRSHSGAFVPIHGFYKLIDGLVNIICENGGSVKLSSCVTEIKMIRNKVVGVMINEEYFDYDVVVSNVSPYLTSLLLKNKTYNKLKFAPASNSLVTYLVGLNGYNGGRMEELINQHIWYISNKPIDYSDPKMLEKPRMMYIGALQNNPILGQGLILFSPGNIAREKGVDKTHLKEVLKAHALKILTTCLPDCEKFIEFLEVYLPSDIERDLTAEDGNVYGKAMSVEGILKNYKKQFNIKNLHICCAATGLPGVATACMSSSLMFHKLTKEKIYE